MGKVLKTLLIGESWTVHTVEAKGFDTFTFDSIGVGTEFIKPVLSSDGFAFEHMPCHRISEDFPKTVEGLKQYDAIIISDVGANTFLLPVETFLQCQRTPNKLQLLKDYVLDGGGLLMAGGYLTYTGIEAKGCWHDSILESVLPVEFSPYDDRREHPEGLYVPLDQSKHPILDGVGKEINFILGYNKATPKKDSETVLRVDGDPLLTLGKFGNGRSIAFATDIAPHWSSNTFCKTNEYKALWRNMIRWLAKEI